MKKITVFGKPGSGKSVLCKKLSAATGLTLYAIDSLLYQVNGERVDQALYDQRHDAVLQSDCWILDGFGTLSSFKRQIDAADVLVYIDLSYMTSYWLVTKRLMKGLFVTPEGWPEGCSVWKGSVQSYRMLARCPEFWNSDFLESLERQAEHKRVCIIRSLSELNRFVDDYVKHLHRA